MGACSPWPTFQSAVSEHCMGRCSNPDTAVVGHLVISDQLSVFFFFSFCGLKHKSCHFTALQVSERALG